METPRMEDRDRRIIRTAQIQGAKTMFRLRESLTARPWVDHLAGCLRFAVVGCLMVILTACDGLLDVDLPGQVEDRELNDPTLGVLLVASAQADFECAHSEYVYSTAHWGDIAWQASGWRDASAWALRVPDGADGGTGQCPETLFRGNFNVYLPLQIARVQAKNAFERIQGFPDAGGTARSANLARAAAYAGYATVHLAELYCEVVLDPDEGAIAPSSAMRVAEEWFTRAIEHAQAAGAQDVADLGRVGRARARNYLGDAAAVADAQAIPEGFVYYATHDASPPRRVNGVYLNNNLNAAFIIAPAYRDLTVDGVPDPRVRVLDTGGVANDGSTPLWVQEHYTSLSDDIPLATWDEAQLIIAEREGGQAAVDAINRIRAKYDLPLFSSTDANEIRDQVIEERRRTLFMQSHRVGDMIRLGLPFETGLDHKNEAYNDALTCYPLPPPDRD
jgi:starch-binding outer membrane protein, SusD/RagB family